ncbi:MAG TPA: hypothetical protein VEF71_18550, partial [Streptosporangiaceae bacterium]|nr:hypothetical protein [Streptosporangiaceae bacterium]
APGAAVGRRGEGMSRARAIAAWAADLTWQDVPAGVRDHATDDLRDVLSVMSAGTLATSA